MKQGVNSYCVPSLIAIVRALGEALWELGGNQ